jgi:hypothetical protein
VNHDGSWRRINKDLAMMNHTSENSKQGSWRRGTRCDGEGQVDIWIQSIKLAMESHISLSVNLYWIIKKRWHGKKWSLDHIMWRSIVTGSRQSCSSQDHVDTLKPRQRLKRHKEESSWQAQVYSYMFYFSLEYRSSYYKEGCNMVILTKPKCSKPWEIPWAM